MKFSVRKKVLRDYFNKVFKDIKDKKVFNYKINWNKGSVNEECSISCNIGKSLNIEEFVAVMEKFIIIVGEDVEKVVKKVERESIAEGRKK